jgi:broad specificity phosphatase PhoE
MTDIYFIRHGQASFGSSNYDQLSELGLKQANILADYLIEMEAYFPVIFSGSLNRQIDTARIVLSKLKENDVGSQLVILPEFDEFDVSSFLKANTADMIKEDPSFNEIIEKALFERQSFKDAIIKILQCSLSEKYNGKGAETYQSFKNRIFKGIEKVIKKTGNQKKVAVFTSGGVLSVILQKATGLSDKQAINLVWEFANTSISVFFPEDGELKLKLDRSVVHLINKKETEILTYI